MKDIKKIVLFKDETSKDGGSWLIIRDSAYEIVSLKEGKRICAEYAAMNGITTREMVNEQLLNKVVFYSSDFNSALRDYVAENIFYVNSNNIDDKNVHAENNDIVSDMTDNLSNDGDYMLAEDAEEDAEALEEKPNQFVMVGNPYVPVESNDDSNSSESSEVSNSEIFSREGDNADNIPVEKAEEDVEALEENPNQFVMVGNPYVPVESNDDSNSSESSEVSNSEIFSRIQDIVNNNPVEDAEALEEKPNQFVMVGNPYVPVEGNDDSNPSESSEVSNSEIFSREEDNVDNILVEKAEEDVEALEEKPNQFVMVGNPYVPVESNDDSNSSESSEVSNSEIFSRIQDIVNNNPVEDADALEEKPNQFVKIGDPYVPVESNDDLNSSKYFEVIDNDEEIEEEPTSEDEHEEEPTSEDEHEEEPPREDEHEEELPREDEHEEEPPREDEHEEEPPREDEHEEEPPRKDEHEEEPPREDEHEEEPPREDEHEEEPPREDEHEEEPPREDEHEEEPPREDEHEEEPTSEEKHEEEVSEEKTMDEKNIGIIDKIKKFGNSALEKLKKFTIFGTIFGMVVAGIVTIFGVKYSLNRDKDDIYVNHQSNTEEFADDEDLYTSPLAKFINKIFPTNEYNESEEILMGDDTDLEIDDNIDDNSNSPIQYNPYLSESEIYDNYDADETDFVETTTDTDTNESGLVETVADTDIDETDFVETTTDTDTNESGLVETVADTDTNDTNFVEPTADSDFYDIAVDSSEDVVLVNDEGSSDEIEFFDSYDANNTLNYTADPSGDQTDLELLDPNYYSAYIDDYINSLESSDVSERGRQYVKEA